MAKPGIDPVTELAIERTVWKYVVPLGTVMDISLPRGAKIVQVGQQVNLAEIVFWAEVTLGGEASLETRTFVVIGTGHKVPRDGSYVGTTVVGSLVWHLYELAP